MIRLSNKKTYGNAACGLVLLDGLIDFNLVDSFITNTFQGFQLSERPVIDVRDTL